MIAKGSILIIDDEKAIRITLKKLLEREGLTVNTADTMKQAHEILSSSPVDAIFADICLPDSSGLQILQYLKDRELNIPVIMITGQPDVDTAADAVRLGAYDYIIKPVPSFKIIHLASNAIEKKRLDDEWTQIEQLKEEYTKRLEREVALQTVQIKESERKYKTLVEQSLVGVFIISNGKIKYANNKFCQIFKYSADEITQDFAVERLIHPTELHRLDNLNDWSQKLREETYIFSPVKGITGSGEEIATELWLTRILYEDNLALQGVIIDVSDRERLRQKEQELELELMNEHRLATIGQLATGIAHNLNNPLSTLMGYTELMMRRYPDMKELGKIFKQSQRMANIIDTLLRKSRRDYDREVKGINLNEVVRDETAFLEANLDYKHRVTKEINLKEHISLLQGVYSDFSQSLQNLINNALDAMYGREKQHLTIETGEDTDFIYLRVSDTGCGIPADNIPKLFDPFFTTKPSRGEQKKDEPVGTGLGLASIYQLLSPYGVKFEIDSKENEGTCFSLKFPKNKVFDDAEYLIGQVPENEVTELQTEAASDGPKDA
jgi:PAS domain S-box-containing protein